MTLSRSCVFVLLLSAACGGGDGGEQPGGDGGHADDTDGAPAVGAPGEIDTSFGDGGSLETDWRIYAIAARETGEVLLATSEYPALVTAGGELAAVADSWVSSRVTRAMPDDDGGWLALHADPYQPAASAIVRLTDALALDEDFGEPGQLTDLGAMDMARAEDGSFFVLGWRGDEDRVAVRKLDAGAAHDPDYGPEEAGEALSPPDHPLDVPVAIASTAAGEIVALAGDGFLPALVRFTSDGEVDEAFGGGVVVLDTFGPRYGRDLVIDDEGRVLVLGMVNSAIQVGRVLSDGALDPTFGEGGMAEVSVTMPLSPDYDEHVEARAMALQPDGAIVIAASYEYDLGEDDVLEEQSVLIVRLLPDGSLDSSFGAAGTARVSLDSAGSPAELAYRNGLAVTADHILVAGRATLTGGEEQGAVRALHR